MRLFSRRPPRPDRTTAKDARERTRAHFRDFVSTRAGVEAFLEPATSHDPQTVVLVARTGEWTRRRVPDAAAARALAQELGIPVYDVHLTGYPSTMRRWSSANRGRR